MNPTTPVESELERTYQNLVNLWTCGVRDYQGLLTAYITANSVFVATIGLLISRQSSSSIFHLLVLALSVCGILITLQMAILLGRFDSRNALWEWRMRGIESSPGWKHLTLFQDLYTLRNQKHILEDPGNNPVQFYPGWAMNTHRRWWARRAVSFPLFFGFIYALFFIWSLAQLMISIPAAG
jgi:hypothetical protein